MSLVVDRSALVMHSAQRMYHLVNDIERYPEFLPWCESSSIVEVSPEQMTATIAIAKGGVRQAFTTCNRLEEGRSIHLSLVDGPFSRLEGQWTFTALRADASKVSLNMQFAFNSDLAKMAFGPVFNQAVSTMVDAFCRRADAIYGSIVE